MLILLGKFTDAPPLQIGGYGFMFILGLVLMLGALQYPTGTNTLSTYNYTESNLTSINETTNKIYTNYSNEIIQGITLNHTIGFFICVLSILGFISVMDNLGKLRKEREKE